MQNLFETQTKTNRIRQQKIRTFRSEVSWVMQSGKDGRRQSKLT